MGEKVKVKVVKDAAGVPVECPICGSTHSRYGKPKKWANRYITDFVCKSCKKRYTIIDKINGKYTREYWY